MDRTIESLRCVIAGMYGVNSFKESGISHIPFTQMTHLFTSLQA